jgi:hypothetical protein
MGRKKRSLEITGKTEDGKLVIGGVFKLLDTHGIPLEITLDKLNESNMICDWIQFWKDGIKAGWPPKRILITLTSVVGDVYGPEFREEWEFRMKAWIRLVGNNEA